MRLQIPTAGVFLPLLEPARYKGAWGGRGSGKSHFFAGCGVEDAVRWPGVAGEGLPRRVPADPGASATDHRFLLGEAMHRAQSQNEVLRGDRDHRPIRHDGFENRERLPIPIHAARCRPCPSAA